MTKNMLILKGIRATSMVRPKTQSLSGPPPPLQSAHFLPNVLGRNNSRVNVSNLCLLYQSFFNFAFPSRVCDAGSSLWLWCLASTLKSPWILDGYLVALQCCTSSAYISPFCCCCCCCCFCVAQMFDIVLSIIHLRRQALLLALLSFCTLCLEH